MSNIRHATPVVCRLSVRQSVTLMAAFAGFVTLLRLTWPAPAVVVVQRGDGAGPAAGSPLSASRVGVGVGGAGNRASSGGIIVEGHDSQRAHPPARVGLLMLIVDRFPPWWPYLVATYKRNAPQYTLIAMHTAGQYVPPVGTVVDDAHIRYIPITAEELRWRFVSRLGASEAQASAKLATLKGLSDLKPFYGKLFEGEASEFSHYGWVDWDILLGDMAALVPERLLWATDALTFPGATLGFAWAGQLTIFQNSAETRELYRAADDFLALGFKSAGDGQSGWEERVFLREVLKKKPLFSINFHMAAQVDYKAQWLTWVAVDHYWDGGRILRCSVPPYVTPGRPPLLLQNESRWLRQVEWIQGDPRGFYESKDRVCLRWDLTSSPWMCCPHSLGVSYVWSGGRLRAESTPYPEHSPETRRRLAAAARAAGARVRVDGSAYGMCQEGAFFHAGLLPSQPAPACAGGTWALLDDIGRFSGNLQVLSSGQCT